MRFTPDESDRQRLRELHGEVLDGADALADHLRQRSYSRLITVGDRVTADLADRFLDPDIAITDGREQRSPVPDQRQHHPDHDIRLTAANPAGSITEAAWSRVREAAAHRCPVAVRIDGEEDLLALPALLFAEPDALVVYGHWQHGAVVTRPDSEMKAWVRELVGIDRHEHLIVGGTWDRLHAGHRYLLLAALEHGERVTVGVTSDRFAAEHTDHPVEPVDDRQQAVERYLDEIGARDTASTVVIDDVYGPAGDAGDALLVTDDTRGSGEQVNRHRREQGHAPLELIEIDQIVGQDGEIISSSRIRSGAIDREGRPDPEV